MGIVLVKGKLVKLFKASSVSQIVREKWKLVDHQSLVSTAVIPFVVLGDKVWSPCIRRQSSSSQDSHQLSTFSAKLIIFYKIGCFQA